MATKHPTEVADPQHYLRLAILRLLETQKCLRPVINMPQLAEVRQQWRENEYTLSEIKSWLESQPPETTYPHGESESTVNSAEKSGHESHLLDGATPKDMPRGGSNTPFAWRTWKRLEPVGSSQVRSSLPSGITLSDSAEISDGRIIFRPPSSSGKP